MSGRVIVIEGLDGSGKSTLSKALAERLGACWLTTPDAELRAVRDVADRVYADAPLASQLFYAASVAHVGAAADAIRQAGGTVVIDRYWLSTVAYAAARGFFADLSDVEARLPPADLTLFVDLDEAERQRRVLRRGASALDLETLDPRRSRVLRRQFRAGLKRPVAGVGVEFDVTGLDEAQVLAAALSLVTEVTAGHLASASRRMGRVPRVA